MQLHSLLSGWFCSGCMLLLYFCIEVQLIYNIVLVLGVQQSDSVLYVCVCVYTLPGLCPFSSKDQLGNLWVAQPSVLTSRGRM